LLTAVPGIRKAGDRSQAAQQSLTWRLARRYVADKYSGYRVVTVPSVCFHHDLLMAKLHYIDYKNFTDGIYGSKGMLHGYTKI